MLTRNQAHGSPGNLLDIYALADIPETEIFSGRVSPLSNKFASSAAHVAGRRLCSSESFTWLSEHFQSDPGKIKQYADYLFPWDSLFTGRCRLAGMAVLRVDSVQFTQSYMARPAGTEYIHNTLPVLPAGRKTE
jgi:hypothetical protein